MSFINILLLRKLAQRSSVIHTFAKYLWNIHYFQELRQVPGLHWMKKISLESNGIFNMFFTSEEDQSVRTLLMNPTGSSVPWSLAVLVKHRPSFLQGMPFTQGTEQCQGAALASKPATEKRRSQRSEPHTLSSSFLTLQADKSPRGERGRSKKITPRKHLQVKTWIQRGGYCLCTDLVWRTQDEKSYVHT